MIMKTNKQIGFIYKNNESIDKILKDGEVVFERGFLRERTSTTLPITFGGVGKDLKDYRVYGNTVQSKLPSGYTQVDYIESSGTQYIDTDFKPNQDTIVEFKSIITQVGSSYGFYGARKGTSSSDSYVLLASRYYGNNTSYQFNYGGGGGVADLNIPNTNINKYLGNKNEFYINDNLQITRPITTFSTNYNLYLMAVNTANTPTLHAYGRLYYFKIYNDTTLVRNFIPCYRNSDNEVGLYDLVNDVFYTNQGTGVFTYGSIAPTPDAPIEMVSCGDRTRNLFLAPTTSSNIYQCTYSKINNNSFSLNYNQETSNNTSYARIDFDITQFKPNTQYTISKKQNVEGVSFNKIGSLRTYINGSNGSVVTSDSLTFTTPNEITSLGIYFYLGYNNTIQGESTITFYDIQIEENSSATPYEPYGYKIPVNVRSENLISQTIYQTNTNLNDSGEMVSNNNYFIMKQTNIKPLSKYVLSENQIVEMTGGNTTPIRVCAYDKNDNFISLVLKNVRTEIKRYVNEFAIPENTDYILIGFRNSDANIELVESIDTNIYLDEPLRKIDGYSDYIDFINGKVVRQLGEVILDGNTNALTYYGTYGTYNAPLFYIEKLDLIIPSNYNKSIILANHYRQYLVDSSGAGGMFNYGIRGATGSHRIYIRDDRYNNANDINNWLSSNNVTVDYVLATPTEESITLPNIPTIDGNNTLNIETEITPSQVYIKYKSNS